MSPISGIIRNGKTAPYPVGNPYRALLRRDYPEPFIALLVFILGIWLWDHYFGKDQGYAPGTEEVALVKIDRDLRIADAMVEDPAWVKWLAGVAEPVTVRREALEVFEKLAKENSISPRGLEAFAIVKAEQDGLPIRAVLGQVLQGEMISDFEEVSARLANHEGTWWQAKLIESWEENVRPGTHWRQIYGEDNIRLKTRAVASRSAVWALGLIGLAMAPRALFRLRRSAHPKPQGYGGAWTLPMGLVVFLVATLAWIGFSMTLDLGISTLPGLHPVMGIFLDSAARMLPTLIALGLIFRRPSHALRVMGLGRRVEWREILGMFSLLMLVDQLLRWLLGGAGSNDPGGGLSLGDAGWWGLAFALISACLLAPIAEEIMYRGVLFRSFRNRLGVVPAAVASSAIFAVLHFYDGYGLASVGVFGFSCALLYSATGSLSTVIALHMLYNTAIKLPEWIVYHAPLG
jgi:membrane protease YdiL (CAAX protease family)